MEKAPKPIPAVEAGKTCTGDVSACGLEGCGEVYGAAGRHGRYERYIAVRDGIRGPHGWCGRAGAKYEGAVRVWYAA